MKHKSQLDSTKQYAELIGSANVGDKVQVFIKNGKLFASKTSKEGYPGKVLTLQGKVAFIEYIVKSNLAISPEVSSTAGNAVGIKIDLPVKVSCNLKVTIED
jgi:hypothetical protein